MMMISRTMIVDNIIHFLFLLLQLKIMPPRDFPVQPINITSFPFYPLNTPTYPSREIHQIEVQR